MYRNLVRGGLVIFVLSLVHCACADMAAPLPPPEATIAAYVFLCVLFCGLPVLGVIGLLALRWLVRRFSGKRRAGERHRGCVVCLTIFVCYLVGALVFLAWQFRKDYEEAKQEEREWRRQRNERRMRQFERENGPDAVTPESVTNSPAVEN